ncbi:hypothetical protein HKD37_15G044060 [Glycine soja]
MKRFANSHRCEVTFAIGYWVYVKLRPYRQTSLADNKFQKLGKVTYRLALPPTAKIHLVFRCSKLKLHQGPLVSDQPLPSASWDNNPIVEPLTILDLKWDNSMPPQLSVLVQWSGLQLEDST